MRRTVYIPEEVVREGLDFPEVLEAVEEAFREKGMGLASMPPKLILPLPGGDVRAMPAYLKGKGVAGVKVVNSHPGNRARGLPTVMATLILVEPDTGFPIAVIEATHLTSMRTAAAGALAIKLLARDNSEIVALIGAGVQARYQLMGMGYVLPRVKEVRVWSMEADLAYRLKEDMLGKVKAEIRVCGSPEEAVSGSDIVITATPSKKPIVMDGWIKDGAHINAIGADAPGKQELDPSILKRARIFLDDFAQGEESGEVNVPLRQGILRKEDIAGEISDLILGRVLGRRSEDEITVFCSTGLAIQDIAAASVLLDKGIIGL
jgi:alanine dehydrogenase